RPYRQEDKSICREPGRQAAAVLSSTLLARPQSRRTGLETPKSRYGRPNGDHRQSRFPHQGTCIYAPITKRPRENPFLLPKAISQIRRMKVNLLMDSLVSQR